MKNHTLIKVVQRPEGVLRVQAYQVTCECGFESKFSILNPDEQFQRHLDKEMQA